MLEQKKNYAKEAKFRKRKSIGQATTEFILLIIIVVGFFILLKKFVGPWVENKLFVKWKEQISEKLFDPQNMHRLPF